MFFLQGHFRDGSSILVTIGMGYLYLISGSYNPEFGICAHCSLRVRVDNGNNSIFVYSITAGSARAHRKGNEKLGSEAKS